MMRRLTLLIIAFVLLLMPLNCASAGGPRIVLVHGWLGSGFDLLYIQTRLSRDGYNAEPVSFTNRGVAGSIADYSAELAVALRELPGRQEIILICHSMGGLVARHCVRNNVDIPVRKVITLGTPHHGTTNSRLAPDKSTSAKEMAPGSDFLKALSTPSEAVPGVQFYSIWTPTDGVVSPAESSVMCGAVNYTVTAMGLNHVSLLASDTVYSHIRDIVAGNPPEPSGPQSQCMPEQATKPLRIL